MRLGSAQHQHIVVTWPKTKPLAAYLDQLRIAESAGEVINFRVPNPPVLGEPDRLMRCYRVHSGAVRGYTDVIKCVYRERGQVRNVDTGGTWPAGWYVVCNPAWHPLAELVPMAGFRGWRWLDSEPVHLT